MRNRATAVGLWALLWMYVIGIAATTQANPASVEIVEPVTTGMDTPSPIILPGGCIGVTPPGGSGPPVCCISGYVWMDGQPVAGASVTITASNGYRQTVITDNHQESLQPYFRLVLSKPPLNIEAGQSITITVRYSSHESSRTWTTLAGGQQVDMVLARNTSQDYMLDRQLWSQAALGALNEPYAAAAGQDGRVYIIDSDNARVQVLSPTGDFIQQWGTLGNLPGQFTEPRAITIDQSGNVYVSDTGNHRIQKFGPDGNLISVWGGFGNAEGQFETPLGVSVDQFNNIYVLDLQASRIQRFRSDGLLQQTWFRPADPQSTAQYPNGIAVDSAGSIYITDTSHHRIEKYTPDGTLLTTFGYLGSGNGQFNLPTGLAVGSDNTLYVADTQNRRIQVLTTNGQFVRAWDGMGTHAGKFTRPTGVTVGSGSVYIADVDNHRIKKFSTTGSWSATLGSRGAANRQFHQPLGIARDQAGNLYVLDAANHRVQKLAPDGTWLLSWGSYGTGNGQFLDPSGLSIDQNNQIYVADTGNHRIVVFNSAGQFQRSWGIYGTAAGQFNNPIGVTVQANQILVAEEGSHRIQRFTLMGSPLGTVGSEGSGLGQLNMPWDVAGDGAGNTYVADTFNNRIERFNSTGVADRVWSMPGRARSVALRSDVLYAAASGSGVASIQMFNVNGAALGQFGRYGSGLGEFIGPDAINTDSTGKIFIADSGNNRIQIWRPMTTTLPIATINWASKLSLVQGRDTLDLVGSATDSDEDGNPAQFTYRWYHGTQLLGTGSTFSIAASSLVTGTVRIKLEVTDDEGEVSALDYLDVDVSPPPAVAWTYMLYLVADSQWDGRQLYDLLDGMLMRIQAQTDNPAVTVVAQIDVYDGPTKRLILHPDGRLENIWEGLSREEAMDTPLALADFVRWAKNTRPAQHYYLAIGSHGNGYQGVAWDSTSGENQYLTAAELREALSIASSNGAAPLDVVHLDACSMGLIDVAYDLRNHVRYLVVSQNLAWAFFLQDRYRQQTTADTTPEQLGRLIVETYADYAESESSAVGSYEEFPYTISALDLTKAEDSAVAIDDLARELVAFASSSAHRGILRDIRIASQKFDSSGSLTINIANEDEYVDLNHWASNIQADGRISDTAILNHATTVISSVNTLVVAQRNSGDRLSMPGQYGGELMRLAGATGVSVYYPTENSRSIPTLIWYWYQNNQLFAFTADTHWNELLRAGNTALPTPPAPLPEPGLPLQPLKHRFRVFMPIIVAR